MPTSFSHIVLCLVTLPLPLLQLLQICYYYFCHRYRYFHTTLLLNTLMLILSLSGAVELTTQLLILENILWLPLCRINKFGLKLYAPWVMRLINTTKKYTSVMIRVCHSRSRFLPCMYIHNKFMTESR